VPTIACLVREIAVDQPVERATTLDDVRAEVLAPTRLNTLVRRSPPALAISIVGVAGVLVPNWRARASSASGSRSIAAGRLLTRVLPEGALMAALGVILRLNRTSAAGRRRHPGRSAAGCFAAIGASIVSGASIGAG
jgi:hypothetical protein